MDFPNPFWTPTEALYYGSLLRIGRMGAATARNLAGTGGFNPDFWAETQRRIQASGKPPAGRPFGEAMDDIRSLFGADPRAKLEFATDDRQAGIVADYVGYIRRILHARLDDLLREQIWGDPDMAGCPPDESSDEASPQDAQDWFALGLAFERGFGRVQDPQEAVRCYRKAALLGCNEGVYREAFLLEMQDIGRPLPDERRAEADANARRVRFLYRKAADGGSPLAMWALAQDSIYRHSPAGLTPTARSWRQRAKEQGFTVVWDPIETDSEDSERCGGSIHDNLEFWGGIVLDIFTPNPSSPLHWFDWEDDADVRLAYYLHRNDVTAGTAFLAWCRITGRFMPRDLEAGIELARVAAVDNDGRYAHFLAWALLQAGGEENAREAIESLERSATLGCRMAKEDLSELQHIGLLDSKALGDCAKPLHMGLHLSRYV